MSDDDWDDWENAEFTIPTINVLNQEQLKRLEERKLIEEADTELAKELFSTTNSDEKIINININKNKILVYKNNISIKENTETKIKKLQNQKDNELKQQELSKKIREAKLKKQREIELYGEPEEIYEYDEYDSLYHS
jgi:hypothetical protein